MLLAWLLTAALAAVTVTGSLFQTYNGIIDGNVCNGTSPVATGLLVVTAPTNVAVGNIGIHQLAFQTVGDGYVYSGSPITINGVSGTYANTCCSCDAIGQSINGGFSECGLTWCGQENRWQYIDFTGTLTVQQNATLTISFPTAIPIAGAGGSPVFSISYALVPLSPSATGSLSLTPSPTGSLSPSSSGSLSQTPTDSLSPTSSLTPSPTESLSPSPTDSLSPTSSVMIAGSTPSVSPSRSESITSSATRSVTPSPSGICYSASRLNGQLTVLGGYYYILPGFNVTQTYGSGFISMGTFVSCSVIGATCKCSYTGGSTVAGCGSGRKSYITYSYGSSDSYSFVNESPTCSYNFVGTIAVSPSISGSISASRTVSRSMTVSATSSPLARPVLIADSATDLSPVQGGNGWYYNYYDGANVLRPMPYYGANIYRGVGPYWQIQNSSVCVIGTTLLHPAHSSACSTTAQGNCKPTISWNNTYPNNNTLYSVSYSASHPSIYPGTNGVKITLKGNGLVLSAASSPVIIAQNNYSIYNLSSLELVQDPLNDCHSDGSTYNLKIYQYQAYPSVSLTRSPSSSPSSSSSASPTPTTSSSQTICQAAMALQGAFEKVTGDVPYFVTHFINIQHFRGNGIPNMLIGNYTGCNETATTCSCTYGPGLTVDGCPSGRFGTINYQFGLSTYTTFVRQYPACHYHFFGSVGILSPSPPISSTPSPSVSTSVTISFSASVTPTLSPSITMTVSVSPSVTLSPTISESVSGSETTSPSITPSVSGSESLTGSPSLTLSISQSSSLSLSTSNSISGSLSETPSLSLSISSSESQTATPSATPSISTTVSPPASRSISISSTRSRSPSISPSVSSSRSLTVTLSSSLSASLSISDSESPSATQSHTTAESPSLTGTPLVYCVPYPSSTPTAFQTPTSTPLFMITPWPLNASVTPSTSPFFMMIPYPSSSPIPMNDTAAAATPLDVTPTVVTGVAVGALGIGSVLFFLQYLKKAKVPTTQANAEEAKEEEEEEEKEENQKTEVQMPDALTYLCINTVDLEDVTFLLTLFKKRFHVIDRSVNMTATS